MLFSPSSPIFRFLFPDRNANIGQDTRLKLWRAGLRMIADHPVTGVGVGRFKMYALSYGADDDPELVHIAHNTYISIGAEMGVPGLVLYLGLFGATLRSLVRLHENAGRLGAGLLGVASESLAIGLVAFGVAAFFVSAEYQKLFWLFVFLSMCLPPLLQSVRRGLERGERIDTVVWNRPSRVHAA
jgi:O-antigen ligase